MERKKQRKQMLSRYFDLIAKLHTEFGHDNYFKPHPAERGCVSAETSGFSSCILFDEHIMCTPAKTSNYGFVGKATRIFFNNITDKIGSKEMKTTFFMNKNREKTTLGTILEIYDRQGNLTHKQYFIGDKTYVVYVPLK